VNGPALPNGTALPNPTSVYLGEDVTAVVTDRIATIWLSRPPVNAMRTRTWTEFGEALGAAAGVVGANVLVIRSELDGIFSAGADVKELPMTPAQDEHRQRLTRDVLAALGRYPVPVIAAIDGATVGGACALVSQADIRLGTARARFGIPEIDVGRCGGTRHLRQHLDAGIVRWMAFTGGWLDAEGAHARGLVTVLVDDLDLALRELTERIAAKSPTALRLAKQSIAGSEHLDTEPGYALEQQFSLELARSADAAEAAVAFAEKRAPRWSTI
jgi:enoyl-CoA hydratase